MSTTKTTTIACGALVMAMSVPLVVQWRMIRRLQSELPALRESAAEVPRLKEENARLAHKDPDPSLELLRLRGQVGLQRRQLAESGQQMQAANARLNESLQRAAKWGDTGAVLTAMEAAALRSLSASARTKLLKDAMAALRSVAETNVTGFQLHLSQVAPEARALLGALQPESDFEVVYQGPLQDLQNPGVTIVVRQITAEEWPDGTFSRVYGFGDGHVEIHRTADGEVDDWERERLVPRNR